MRPDLDERVSGALKQLNLSAVRSVYKAEAERARNEEISYEAYLWELIREETDQRRERKIQRLLRASKLPLEKNLETFELDRLALKTRRQVQSLLDGTFLDRRENILAFGAPGGGKTHLLCAIGQHLVQAGRPVLFTTCSFLVQHLLGAKNDLTLEKALGKLRRFEALIIDDIGYVQQSREEMEVLFTLLADRYERRSVMLTSNLPFSQWDRIFKDPMTTAAAIDRLVYHSVILELNIESFRMRNARARKTMHTESKDN